MKLQSNSHNFCPLCQNKNLLKRIVVIEFKHPVNALKYSEINSIRFNNPFEKIYFQKKKYIRYACMII